MYVYRQLAGYAVETRTHPEFDDELPTPLLGATIEPELRIADQ